MLSYIHRHAGSHSTKQYQSYTNIYTQWTFKGKKSWPNKSGASWQPEFYLYCLPCSIKIHVGRVDQIDSGASWRGRVDRGTSCLAFK
jgi:hypothetical protein